MSDIKKGDTVQLKSGSPDMTVQDIGDYFHTNDNNGAFCVWFDGMNPKEKAFDLATLIKISG